MTNERLILGSKLRRDIVLRKLTHPRVHLELSHGCTADDRQNLLVLGVRHRDTVTSLPPVE